MTVTGFARLSVAALIVVVWVGFQGTSVRSQQPRRRTAQTESVEPVNSGANPYRAILDWARSPRRTGRGVAPTVWLSTRTACPCGRSIDARRARPRDASVPTRTPFTCSTSRGQEVRSFGAGVLVWPHGIHVDRDGNVWVADARTASADELQTFPGEGDKGSVVVKFSPDGDVLMTLGTPGVRGNPPDALTDPTDVVTDPGNGDVYVAESHTNVADPDLIGRISVFDSAGNFLRIIGGTGTGPGESGRRTQWSSTRRDG